MDPDKVPTEELAPPVVHVRFAYRVRKVLEALRDRVDVIDLNRERPSVAHRPPGFEGDFVLAALDVRLLVVLLSGIHSIATLLEEAVKSNALNALQSSSDVEGVVVVVDDDPLTSVVFEMFDRSDTFIVPSGDGASGRHAFGPLPLRELVAEYLDLFAVEWETVGDLSSVELFDTTAQVSRGAEAALAERKVRDVRVAAKIAARDRLSESDAKWAAGLCLRVYETGNLDELNQAIDDRASAR